MPIIPFSNEDKSQMLVGFFVQCERDCIVVYLIKSDV